MEWPTVFLIGACSLAILLITAAAAGLSLWLVTPVLGILLALHSSLQHEVLHGHPSRHAALNEALVCIPFGLFIPFRRFRDTHLRHHVDARLTDPYDDPESNYADPQAWCRRPSVLRQLLMFNNTLAGRMLIGPWVGLYCFYRQDLVAAWRGEHSVTRAYALHAAGLMVLTGWLAAFGTMPAWAYALSAWFALSLLRVRTYLEHRAHRDTEARTAIVEDRGFFSWLFLNNNLHLVHHLHPRTPWYCLPALYRARREDFLRRNDTYVYTNYRSIFAAYLFRAKDPVAHPLWSTSNRASPPPDSTIDLPIVASSSG